MISSRGELLKSWPRFFRIVLARIIDQKPTHYLTGDTEKMSPILPIHPGLVHQPQVRLVDESRWLHGVIRAFVTLVIRSKLSQFIVDYG